MFQLQRLVIEEIQVENNNGEIEIFKDEEWKKVKSFPTKMEAREYIFERYEDKGQFRLIHPGGGISNPMNIKLEGEQKKVTISMVREEQNAQKERYRICDDYEPILRPRSPITRMRLLVKGMKNGR